MNKEQVSGKIEQAVGKAKQGLGEAVGNDTLANDGVVEQAKGAAKETLGDAKHAAQQIHDSHKVASVEKTEQSRDKLSQSIDDAEEKVKGKIQEFKERHTA